MGGTSMPREAEAVQGSGKLSTPLYLVSVGTAVMQQGKRRLVDPVWLKNGVERHAASW